MGLKKYNPNSQTLDNSIFHEKKEDVKKGFEKGIKKVKNKNNKNT